MSSVYPSLATRAVEPSPSSSVEFSLPLSSTLAGPPAKPAGILVVLVNQSRDEQEDVQQELLGQGFQFQTCDLNEPASANTPPAVRDLYAVLRRRFRKSGQPTALLLNEPPASPPKLVNRILAFDEFVLDCGRREVHVDDQLVALTKTEFDLLYVLARQPGIVFSREQIVTAYKGFDYPVTLRSVDVQIFGLRRKLGRSGSRLQTVRGVGYRFLDGERPAK